MTRPQMDLDIYIGAAASVLGLEVDPTWLGPVRFHLEISIRMASLVGEFELPDEAEPAPIFSS